MLRQTWPVAQATAARAGALRWRASARGGGRRRGQPADPPPEEQAGVEEEDLPYYLRGGGGVLQESAADYYEGRAYDESAGLRVDSYREAEEGIISQLTPTAMGRYAKTVRASEKALKRSERGQQQRKVGVAVDAPPEAQRGVHRSLAIMSGAARRLRLLCPEDLGTRPMMKKTRGAVFSMLLSRQVGGAGQFPSGTRWLDLFAGTGSVGLEALSRGCEECHFVELDGWVVRECLRPNIAEVSALVEAEKARDGLSAGACQIAVHQQAVDSFLGRAVEVPGFAGGAFDFVSCCPPYREVSYPDLLASLAQSPLLHERSWLLVEYAKENAEEIPDALGPLELYVDRRFGRTFIALYGPAGA